MSGEKPARHGKSNFLDKRSVSVVEELLTTHERVMPQLASIDKWPNIDGYLELQDANEVLLGRMEVQVKTLPGNHKHKVRVGTSFLHYCHNVSQVPVLLLGVDQKERKIYWLHIDRHVVSSLNIKSGQKEKIIQLNPNRFFSEGDRDYLHEWELIIKANKERVHNYDELRDAYIAIREVSNPDLGQTNSIFSSIHTFLDRLNELLDKNFPILKRRLYPNAWKIGFAYYSFTEKSSSYILYPIGFDYNDVQIKRIDTILHNKLTNRSWTTYSRHNPIMDEPHVTAYNIIKEHVFKLLDDRLLDHSCDFLALEFVHSTLIRNMWRLDIEYKDSYTIDEVEELIRSGAIENVLKHQSQKVKYPYHVFYEALSYLKNKGFDRIHKINKDYLGILAEYSEKNFEDSLIFFFENFTSTYECMIGNNFPSLKKELSLFGEADLVVISHAKEKGAYSPTRLWIESICLSSVTVETRQIITRRKAEYDESTYLREFLNPERNHLIEYSGNYYEPTFGYSIGMGGLISETPMMDFIYDILKIKIRNYLALINPL